MSTIPRSLAPGTAGSGRTPSPIRDFLRRHRFLRFLLTGVLNTAVGYGLFLAALAVLPDKMSALVVSAIAAVNSRFVFGKAA